MDDLWSGNNGVPLAYIEITPVEPGELVVVVAKEEHVGATPSMRLQEGDAPSFTAASIKFQLIKRTIRAQLGGETPLVREVPSSLSKATAQTCSTVIPSGEICCDG